MTEDLLTEDDLIVFVMQSISDFQAGEFGRIDRASRLLDGYRSAAFDLSPNFYVVFLSMEMRTQEAQGHHEEARTLAGQVLEHYKTLYEPRNEFATTLNSLRDLATSLLETPTPRGPSKKLGRNTRVRVKLPDGREVRTKYKFVEADVRAGRSEVLEVL